MTDDSITLREYFDIRLTALERGIEQARQSMEKRLDGMNEFRNALKDQSSKSPSRIEVETKIDALEKEIKTLNSFMDTVSGKASQSSVTTAQIIGYVSLGVALISLTLRLFGK